MRINCYLKEYDYIKFSYVQLRAGVEREIGVVDMYRKLQKEN